MERKTIVEECKTYKNEEGYWTADETIGFYIKDNEVTFKHSIVAVDNADCWIEEETFPIGNYKSGIQELMKKGCCQIKGADLSEIGGVGYETLKLRKISDDLLEVDYRGLRSGSIHFHCDVNKLGLK